ncbi:MAG: hypothetical protein IJD28_07765 [Deferribacterales bacterium]|nr:hypothetical protein [Deferribacterales bacterium]
MGANTCCFIGHRNINETEELKIKLMSLIEKLIEDENVDTFLFGSKSRFNSLCLELVTKIKEKHPHVKRIYVRAEFPAISDDYKAYLLKSLRIHIILKSYLFQAKPFIFSVTMR